LSKYEEDKIDRDMRIKNNSWRPEIHLTIRERIQGNKKRRENTRSEEIN